MIQNKLCPNCRSNKYRETISREHCPACGLECDYWGDGANEVYESMMQRNARAEADARWNEDYEWRKENGF